MNLKAWSNGPIPPVGLVGYTVVLLLIFALQRRLRRRGPLARVQQDGGSWLLGQWIMEFGYWLLGPAVALCLRLSLHPTTITLAGLLAVLAGSVLAALGYLFLAGGFLLMGAMADMLDGVIARRQNLGSEAGEFIDAVSDRYADMMPLMGLAIFYGDQPGSQAAILLALMGGIMMSYARAKGEALGVADAPRGTMRRAERAVYLGFAVLLAPGIGSFAGGALAAPTYALVPGMCLLIGLGANASALQMARFTTLALRRRGAR